ncbi:MAG: histidinol-phosphate transaminase [Candidatus Altiarchaeota archaeon]|nr:histidinol-phosphate transaminase [Candidatus Altiarchaeota archaeon]
MKQGYCIRPGVSALPEYVPGEYRRGFIKLASNENNFGPSRKVVETLKSLADKTGLYPYREGDVRAKIAKYAGVNSENIVLGNGSDEVMDLIVKAFRGPYAGMYPSFPVYKLAAKIMGEGYVEVPYDDGFRFNARKFISKAEGAKVFFLCSPNNPTGTSISDTDLKKVLATGKLVVLDEAYVEFTGKSRASWVRKYQNLIVLRTMAKAFALAGLRIGYGIAPKEIVDILMKVKPPFNTSSFAQEAALAALEDISYMRKNVAKIRRGRDKIYNALSKKFKPVKSDSNFILFDVSPMTADEFFNKMLSKKIIVRKYGKFKGFPGEYIRVNAGTEEETEKFINAVNNI